MVRLQSMLRLKDGNSILNEKKGKVILRPTLLGKYWVRTAPVDIVSQLTEYTSE